MMDCDVERHLGCNYTTLRLLLFLGPAPFSATAPASSRDKRQRRTGARTIGTLPSPRCARFDSGNDALRFPTTRTHAWSFFRFSPCPCSTRRTIVSKHASSYSSTVPKSNTCLALLTYKLWVLTYCVLLTFRRPNSKSYSWARTLLES